METIHKGIRGELMTPQEVAKKLRVSLPTVYNMAKNGELPACRIRLSLRFDSADVDDYLFFSKYHYGCPYLKLSNIDKEQIINRFEEQVFHAKQYIEKLFNKPKRSSEKKQSASHSS